jgi:glutathione synthase/RimK-type ligase-like ATP-grasp enzyme
MLKCAFLTLNNTKGWVMDDDLAIPELEKLGWTVASISWRDKMVDWNDFDVVVIRTPWDYQDEPEAFFSVLENIERSNARLENPLELVRWNINKNYLFDLENKGVELVPTVKGNDLSPDKIAAHLQSLNTHEIVVKPIIGANADDTFRITNNTDATQIENICKTFKNRDYFVQPFMQYIVDEGEYSLIFFGGEYSHTILKIPGAKDFRVQEEHGASVKTIEQPEPEIIKTAQRALNALDEPPLYARVDLVRTTKNRFALMELELIEPCLYFRFGEQSTTLFANAVSEMFATKP